MFQFSKAKKKLQEATLNKFFASWLRGWCDGIARGLVPQKPKHGRLRGDWLLKTLNNMVNSSEKVPFCVGMQCSSLRAEAFLVYNARSQPTQLTHYQHAANSWLTVGRKFSQKAVNDSRPTVGQQSDDCRPTVGQQSADSRPTVGWLSADSFMGELFFTFSDIVWSILVDHSKFLPNNFSIQDRVYNISIFMDIWESYMWTAEWRII